MKHLIISRTTPPTDALELPEGSIIIGIIEASFSRENVIEAAELIAKNGGYEKPFVSQAGIIAYAGNNLGWGMGGGYQTI